MYWSLPVWLATVPLVGTSSDGSPSLIAPEPSPIALNSSALPPEKSRENATSVPSTLVKASPNLSESDLISALILTSAEESLGTYGPLLSVKANDVEGAVSLFNDCVTQVQVPEP